MLFFLAYYFGRGLLHAPIRWNTVSLSVPHILNRAIRAGLRPFTGYAVDVVIFISGLPKG